MRKILEECPSCGSALVATELSCTACDTVVHGHFAPCRFCRLAPEDLAFLEVFVKNRGNVKEMERDLGISYWSIRNRLNEVVAALDFEEVPPVPQDEGVSWQRQEILERLDRGEITVAEATQLLSRSES
ncbi:MAG TPA: DUF2089 domain-containing protein [Candidatus Sulfomarinibacteraceae bacterium]|nr:DUF2089 domain-containing protein [Candidatus Sulfomarinibacteraceae bacterium]